MLDLAPIQQRERQRDRERQKERERERERETEREGERETERERSILLNQVYKHKTIVYTLFTNCTYHFRPRTEMFCASENCTFLCSSISQLDPHTKAIVHNNDYDM